MVKNDYVKKNCVWWIGIQTNDTSDLVKKADCNTKIDEIENKVPDHDKYITPPELNRLMK